jgi:hypothetical protein
MKKLLILLIFCCLAFLSKAQLMTISAGGGIQTQKIFPGLNARTNFEFMNSKLKLNVEYTLSPGDVFSLIAGENSESELKRRMGLNLHVRVKSFSEKISLYGLGGIAFIDHESQLVSGVGADFKIRKRLGLYGEFFFGGQEFTLEYFENWRLGAGLKYDLFSL